MSFDDSHEHPGGDVPHRHDEADELAVHDAAHTPRADQPMETMHLREEELHARKQAVETGRVRVGKEVVAEQRTLEVPVTREEVTIERHPVSRQPSDSPIGEEDQTINVPVYEEQASAEKQAVVYEEIGVGKRAVQETQHVSGTVKREEARIENDGALDVRSGN